MLNRKIFHPALLLLVVIGLSGAVGYDLGRRAPAIPLEGRVANVGMLPDRTFTEDVDFRMFWDVWSRLKRDFYRQPVSDKALYYGAVRGLVGGVDDPYSVFFDPKDTKLFLDELAGAFDGVGMEIGVRDDQLQVIAPLPNTPAEKAGVQAGDKIYFIDGTDTTGMSVEDAVLRIRGAKGTSVKIIISRDGWKETKEIEMVRDTIRIDSVTWTIGDDHIAKIKIAFFNEDSSGKFRDAIQEALAKGATGFIIDLRNDPGGLLDQAVTIGSEWVGTRTMVIERQRDVDAPIAGDGAARLGGLKTVVLVNGGSASASEILAGALKDYGLATLVGETTFGKGSVQDYQELLDGSSLKMTVAEWLTPAGHSIHEVGIEPDVTVELSSKDVESGKDPQMEVALKIAKGTYEGAKTTATK